MRAPLFVLVFASLALVGCHHSTTSLYRHVPQAKFKVSGAGVAQAGPYKVKWWANQNEQASQDYGDGPRLPVGATLIVDGPRGPEEHLRLVQAGGTVDKVVTGHRSTGFSYSQIEPNLPGSGQGHLQVGSLPTRPVTCQVDAKIVRVVRVWDVVRVKHGQRLKGPRGESGYASGLDKWSFSQVGPGTSELGLPVATEKVPHNSDQIRVDLSPLRTKYKAISWTLYPTETTAGPTNRDGMASGTSGQKGSWVATFAPEVPNLETSKEFPDLWVRFYVDLVIGEYPFTYEVKVTPAP
jgi:hypothetical protein